MTERVTAGRQDFQGVLNDERVAVVKEVAERMHLTVEVIGTSGQVYETPAGNRYLIPDGCSAIRLVNSGLRKTETMEGFWTAVNDISPVI